MALHHDIELNEAASRLFTGEGNVQERVSKAIMQVADSLGIAPQRIADALNTNADKAPHPIQIDAKYAINADRAVLEQLAHIAPDIGTEKADKPIIGKHTANIARQAGLIRDCERER